MIRLFKYVRTRITFVFFIILLILMLWDHSTNTGEKYSSWLTRSIICSKQICTYIAKLSDAFFFGNLHSLNHFSFDKIQTTIWLEWARTHRDTATREGGLWSHVMLNIYSLCFFQLFSFSSSRCTIQFFTIQNFFKIVKF